MADNMDKFLSRCEISNETKPNDINAYFRKRFIAHDKLINDFVRIYRPDQNQIIFLRAISLHNIFKDSISGKFDVLPIDYLETVKKNTNNFPVIGSFKKDDPKNVCFEPILNRNLLNLNIPPLQSLVSFFGKSKSNDKNVLTIKNRLSQELSILNKEKTSLGVILDRVPDIISKTSKSVPKVNPDKTPKVSVITISFNLVDMVEETMRSVANQDLDNYEHIVVDGASTDGSLELIKKYPNIILVSEKDSGPDDALWKAFRMARGEYVIECLISDSIATIDWIRRCAEIMDNKKEISLVWGFVCCIDSDSKMKEIANPRPNFRYDEAPQGVAMFDYWIRTGRFQPEGNLCVRRSVLLKCFPKLEECTEDILDWTEFAYRFNSGGYLSEHIPILANFFHSNHGNQLGIKLGKTGQYQKSIKNYNDKLKSYRRKLIWGITKHRFIDANGNELPIYFDRKRLFKEYVLYKILKLFRPRTYINVMKQKI